MFGEDEAAATAARASTSPSPSPSSSDHSELSDDDKPAPQAEPPVKKSVGLHWQFITNFRHRPQQYGLFGLQVPYRFNKPLFLF